VSVHLRRLRHREPEQLDGQQRVAQIATEELLELEVALWTCLDVSSLVRYFGDCERVDLVRVRRAARVERIAHAAIAKQGALARSARCAYDVRAERAQHLERGESDSAGRLLHEYARLRRGLCRTRQRHVDRHEHRRRRRRGGERNHVRLACRRVHRRARVRAQAAGRQTQQRLACTECARRQR